MEKETLDYKLHLCVCCFEKTLLKAIQETVIYRTVPRLIYVIFKKNTHTVTEFFKCQIWKYLKKGSLALLSENRSTKEGLKKKNRKLRII